MVFSRSGKGLGTRSYSPWGAVTAHSGAASTSVLFAGAYRNAETELLYVQARHDGPAFLTIDAIGALTGQAYVYTGG
ncbi:RHS repeat-associated core domain-containing protein [Propionibacterium cyclohexanicum]|uniref:RHS repeat-associated core domain-containing protein n=1 Tax=Propionibacterium cyclohexanicum TaxID=64702 RepID=A0A1H9TJC6_9ACTN|nr:RHS repeat-associated core domain-containing protein [Propionibacterium cyclohexanicum]